MHTQPVCIAYEEPRPVVDVLPYVSPFYDTALEHRSRDQATKRPSGRAWYKIRHGRAEIGGWMMGVVLLTGATGFVGRQVLKALGECGIQIRVVIREGRQGRLAALEAIEMIVTT